jgi:hypothetical protein
MHILRRCNELSPPLPSHRVLFRMGKNFRKQLSICSHFREIMLIIQFEDKLRICTVLENTLLRRAMLLGASHSNYMTIHN